jgi:hypothetical protein
MITGFVEKRGLLSLFISILMLSLFSQYAASQTHLDVIPESPSMLVSDDINVEVTITGVQDLYGFQFDLVYNSSVLEFNSISEGGFISWNHGSNVFCVNPDTGTPGEMRQYACTRLESGNASGNGVLAEINFTANSSGTSLLELENVVLSDLYSENISFTLSGGNVTATTCVEGTNSSCGPDNESGICTFGNRTCSGGVLGPCVGAVYPDDEVCDGLDNDCSGIIDDIDGGDSVESTDCRCYDGGSPSQESCPHNGIDDDCDGSVDEVTCEESSNGGGGGGGGGGCSEGSRISCSGTGICQPAYRTCHNGVWGACTGEREPTTEVCNGIDDDCDGLIDDRADCCEEGEKRECGPPNSTGICTRGISTCMNGVFQACMGAVFPQPETCDGLDNDCDGIVDDACASGNCPDGAIPYEGCLCGGDIRNSGYCCSGVFHIDGCPFPWAYLIYAGIAILIVLYVLVLYFKMKGEELSWETIREKYL